VKRPSSIDTSVHEASTCRFVSALGERTSIRACCEVGTTGNELAAAGGVALAQAAAHRRDVVRVAMISGLLL
jgi:hypothetical protein